MLSLNVVSAVIYLNVVSIFVYKWVKITWINKLVTNGVSHSAKMFKQSDLGVKSKSLKSIISKLGRCSVKIKLRCVPEVHTYRLCWNIEKTNWPISQSLKARYYPSTWSRYMDYSKKMHKLYKGRFVLQFCIISNY